MTATARPWRVWGNEIEADDPHDFDDVVIAIVGASSGMRSAPHYVANEKDVKAANAALIVRAVNNHEPLLEALKACAAVCAGETFHKAGLVEALEKARAAIAAAEKV